MPQQSRAIVDGVVYVRPLQGIDAPKQHRSNRKAVYGGRITSGDIMENERTKAEELKNERERIGVEILQLIDDLEGQVTEYGCLSYSSPQGQWVQKDTIKAAIKEKFGLEI